eukprot:GHVT01086786.1.p2 GENE.GHVT01086786.1~~GHVT01086786.1.p2  ORF type:complete len:101 (+),score=6.34 GHVT01086786.1:505-807(+)
MSDRGGDASRPEQSGFQDAIEKMLAGLLAMGRVIRDAGGSGVSCVRRTAYPVKETCVGAWDSFSGQWEAFGTRTAPPPENVIVFTGENRDAGSSVSSRHS